MNNDTPITLPIERRHLRRQRVLKGALVVFEDHARAFDCLVRNLTAEGAKITVTSTRDIPEVFHLLIASEQRIAPARAIWRSGDEIGIAFTGDWASHRGRG